MQELLKALVKAQMEIQPPRKNGMNKFTKSRYALLDDIYESCRVPLANNGLVLTHTVSIDKERDVLVTTLLHESGEKMENSIPLFSMKSENASQGFAGGLTYARRYAICCLLALPADEDDDGNEPSKAVEPKAPPIVHMDKAAEEKLNPPTQNSNDAQFRAEMLRKIEEISKRREIALALILKSNGVSTLYDVKTNNLSAVLNTLQSRPYENN